MVVVVMTKTKDEMSAVLTETIKNLFEHTISKTEIDRFTSNRKCDINSTTHEPTNSRGEPILTQQTRGLYYGEIKSMVTEPRIEAETITAVLSGLYIGSQFFFVVGTSSEAYLIDPDLDFAEMISIIEAGRCEQTKVDFHVSSSMLNFSFGCVKTLVRPLLFRRINTDLLQKYFIASRNSIIFVAAPYSNDDKNFVLSDVVDDDTGLYFNKVKLTVVGITPHPHPSNYSCSCMPQHESSTLPNYQSDRVDEIDTHRRNPAKKFGTEHLTHSSPSFMEKRNIPRRVSFREDGPEKRLCGSERPS